MERANRNEVSSASALSVDSIPMPELSSKLSRHEIEQLVSRYSRTVVRYPAFQECMTAIEDVHFAGRHCRKGARGVLIYGLSGCGKSTLADEYAMRYPAIEEAERTITPVLLVEFAGQPTAKVIGSNILEALRDPFAHSGTAEARMSRVKKLLHACGVEVIIFDEVQHVTCNVHLRNRSIAADTLKNLMNATGIPCIFMGTHDCKNYFMENQQLGRRCSPQIELQPFNLQGPADKSTFLRVLKTLNAALPVVHKSVLVDSAVALQVYFATFGVIGVLIQLTSDALRKALSSGEDELTREHLRAAFKERHGKKIKARRNPFADDFDGRPLTVAGEPFHAFIV